MHRIIFTLLAGLALLGSASSAQAQQHVIKLNLFSPIVRTVSGFYENAFSETTSAQLGFFYTGTSIDDTKFSGFGITPEIRFYLSETTAPEGFYAAPFIRYQNFDLTDESTDSRATLNNFGGGLLIGKQWIFKERIALDAFIGPSYVSGSLKVKSEGTNEDIFETGAFDGFGVRLGLSFGVAF